MRKKIVRAEGPEKKGNGLGTISGRCFNFLAIRGSRAGLWEKIREGKGLIISWTSGISGGIREKLNAEGMMSQRNRGRIKVQF